MAKIQIKSEKLTPFGGIFHVMELFEHHLSQIIDETLGKRSVSIGYDYSEIIRSLMCVYFCGGSCVEDVSNHLMGHLSLHPLLRTCSSDTILRMMKELSCDNITYSSDSGKDYDFNTCDKVNELLVNALVATGQLEAGREYDLDFDHEFLEAEKYDAKMTYKYFSGYSPGVAVINNMIVGIENRDGNANVRFHQQDTLERFYTRLEGKGITINRSRMDCGSCSEEIVKTVARHLRGNTQRMNDRELAVIQSLLPIHLLVPLVAFMVHHHGSYNFFIYHGDEQLTVGDGRRQKRWRWINIFLPADVVIIAAHVVGHR